MRSDPTIQRSELPPSTESILSVGQLTITSSPGMRSRLLLEVCHQLHRCACLSISLRYATNLTCRPLLLMSVPKWIQWTLSVQKARAAVRKFSQHKTQFDAPLRRGGLLLCHYAWGKLNPSQPKERRSLQLHTADIARLSSKLPPSSKVICSGLA